MLAAMIDGLSESGASSGAGASGVRRDEKPESGQGVKNGANLASVMSIAEMCWGDVGLLLSMPRQGLGNAAVASVATEEQLARFGHLWASMAITEPECGSDSAAIRTTARLDGDHYVLNGEKIFVTSGERADSVVETHLYRIAQEALNNVVKHSKATHVAVLLEKTTDGVVLVVEDNGVGFDPESAVSADQGHGLGLVGMRERANLIGGEIEIESEAGRGTAIYVKVRPRTD